MKIRILAFLLLFGMATAAPAQINIGINFSLFPDLVRVPDYPVYYAPRQDANYFFYDGFYWVFRDDEWYSSDWYNGPWYRVAPEYVPLYVLRVPVRYYRRPPAYFSGWQRNAPPRWGQHWGRDWEQHHTGWDRWNRRSAPKPAPIPTYQRKYTGNRYPQADQRHNISDRNYRYQPRDALVREHVRPQVRPASATQDRQPDPRKDADKGRPEPRKDAGKDGRDRNERSKDSAKDARERDQRSKDAAKEASREREQRAKDAQKEAQKDARERDQKSRDAAKEASREREQRAKDAQKDARERDQRSNSRPERKAEQPAQQPPAARERAQDQRRERQEAAKREPRPAPPAAQPPRPQPQAAPPQPKPAAQPQPPRPQPQAEQHKGGEGKGGPREHEKRDERGK